MGTKSSKQTPDELIPTANDNVELYKASPYHKRFIEAKSTITDHTMYVVSCTTNDSRTRIFCMGECKDQLGIGRVNNVQSEPAVIETLIPEKIVQICAGFVHSIALTVDGRVYTFGSPEDGKLGYTSLNSSKPNLVSALEDKFVMQVSAGYNHSIFLTREHTVHGAGSNSYQQLCCATNGVVSHAADYDKARIVRVVCGYYHTLLISSLGKVFYRGKDEPMITYTDPPGFMRSLNDEFIVSAGAGYSHSMFISKKGEIWMYGDNSSGQLGVSGNYGFFNIPFKLERLINKRVIDCDGGYYHSIILIDDGKIYTCGSSQYGKLGIGKDRNTKEKANVVQTLVDNGDIVRSISAGGYHSAISTVTGKAYIMGHGSFGQCGQGAKLENFLAPVKVTLGGVDSAFISQAVAGGWHTLLLENSTALCVDDSLHKKLQAKLQDQDHDSFFDVDLYCYSHTLQ